MEAHRAYIFYRGASAEMAPSNQLNIVAVRVGAFLVWSLWRGHGLWALLVLYVLVLGGAAMSRIYKVFISSSGFGDLIANFFRINRHSAAIGHPQGLELIYSCNEFLFLPDYMLWPLVSK